MMDSMFKQPFTVCIPSAGSGSRLGAFLPKQYLDIAGKPVLAHTLAVFEALSECEQIMIATDNGTLVEQILKKYPVTTRLTIVSGGLQRQDSVANMLTACADNDDSIVLVHDAARPCITGVQVREVVRAIAEHGAALLALPARDTVKQVQGDEVIRTLIRDEVWLAQTPQGARLGMLRHAFQLAGQQAFVATDEAELLERAGYSVKAVPGSAANIKITYQEDIRLAEALLRSAVDDTFTSKPM
jgi:2-C-methyl-D-erythritol 4-phosphate cytidylyltransferase